MNYINTILGFLKKAFNKENIQYTLFIIVFILSIFLFKTCQNLSNEKAKHKQDIIKYENNQKAMTDSVVTAYNKKLQQDVSDKTAFMITTVDELKKYNDNLYKEMISIKGTVAALNSKVIINGATGNAGNTVIKIDTNLYGLNWAWMYSDSGFKQNLKGESRFRLIGGNVLGDKTSIIENKMEIGLSYGFQDLGDKYKVWATSSSPLIKFSELDGAMLINKEKPKKISHWSAGPTFMFGINSDVTGKSMRFGWGIGFGVTYNIFGNNNSAINKKFRLFKKNE